MTTGKNILWGTDNYLSRGDSYSPECEIKYEQITSYNGSIIKPRTKKSKVEQTKRIRDKAEVFTPAWVCNKQNNLIDTAWFKQENVFNVETIMSWKATRKKIVFPEGKAWYDYVKELRMEITCGEAPYLVSRYDTTTGNIIPVMDRIGLLDRKIRIVNENVKEENEWYEWIKEAFKSIYAFEWQGDSLLIARENLLYTFSDNYKYKFEKKPTVEQVKEIANIISWNIFQMDGTKFVVPYSCKNDIQINYTLFGEEKTESMCPGCKKNNYKIHNGIYVKIMNWVTNKKVKFVTIMNRSSKNGK